MNRKNIARLLLVATILGAVSLEMVWLVVNGDTAGTGSRMKVSGPTAMPILEAMIGINLATMIALFLLPRWAQRLTLAIAFIGGLATLVKVVQWSLENELRLAPILALGAAVMTIAVAVPAIFARLSSPRGPQSSRQTDKWHALDQGIDPTLDE